MFGNSIVLIGLSGVGKTTVGQKLAKVLTIPFVDTDQIIIAQQAMPVSEIFESKGEAYFRDSEQQALFSISVDKKQVISTGGGIILKRKNRDRLRTLGTIVWLDLPPQIIVRRLQKDATRPLLNSPDKLTKLQKLFDERESYYRSLADIVVSCEEKSLSELVSEIISSL